jgi:hypothetical protein
VEALERYGNLFRRPSRGQLGAGDPSWLEWCYEHDFVIVTCNVRHFRRLHVDRLAQGKLHCGIIGVAFTPDRDVMTQLLLELLTTLEPNDVVGEMIVLESIGG